MNANMQINVWKYTFPWPPHDANLLPEQIYSALYPECEHHADVYMHMSKSSHVNE